MKSNNDQLTNSINAVVPHAGTWIEISIIIPKMFEVTVVPHAGTWIEMVMASLIPPSDGVVPHAGTWIEIVSYSSVPSIILSFPTRERGLKFTKKLAGLFETMVVPHAGTWIEIWCSQTQPH